MHCNEYSHIKKIKNYVLLLTIFLFVSCANEQIQVPVKNTSLLLIKSKSIKFNDAIFVDKTDDKIKIKALSLGKHIANIVIRKDEICLNFLCYEMKNFNNKYLSKRYTSNILNDIMRERPIYDGANIEYTKNGFIQNIPPVIYRKEKNYVYFYDKKANIIIKLLKIND